MLARWDYRCVGENRDRQRAVMDWSDAAQATIIAKSRFVGIPAYAYGELPVVTMARLRKVAGNRRDPARDQESRRSRDQAESAGFQTWTLNGRCRRLMGLQELAHLVYGSGFQARFLLPGIRGRLGLGREFGHGHGRLK